MYAAFPKRLNCVCVCVCVPDARLCVCVYVAPLYEKTNLRTPIREFPWER